MGELPGPNFKGTASGEDADDISVNIKHDVEAFQFPSHSCVSCRACVIFCHNANAYFYNFFGFLQIMPHDVLTSCNYTILSAQKATVDTTHNASRILYCTLPFAAKIFSHGNTRRQIVDLPHTLRSILLIGLAPLLFCEVAQLIRISSMPPQPTHSSVPNEPVRFSSIFFIDSEHGHQVMD